MPLRWPWPRREPNPPPCNAPLSEGEAVLRGQPCALQYGRERKRGVLHLTNRRLIFEAERGDARWLIIPLDEVARAAAYRDMASTAFRLWVETTQGEQAPFLMPRRDAESWARAIDEARKPPEAERLVQ